MLNIEEFAFEQYKNYPTRNAQKFKDKIKKQYPEINANNLYVRIVNYQVNKYGESLDNDNEHDFWEKVKEARKKKENFKKRRRK